MKRKSTYFSRIFFIITFYIIGSTNLLKAQELLTTRLGITWESPNSSNITSKLSFYNELGVRYIELKHPVPTAVLDSVSKYSFLVFVRFDKSFLTNSDVQRDYNFLLEEYSSLVMHYAEYESVVAYGLYSYSQSYHPQFATSFELIKKQLRQLTNREFYEINSNSQVILDFSLFGSIDNEVPNNTTSVVYSKNYQREDLAVVNEMFKNNPSIIFLHSNWLESAINDYQPFLNSLHAFVTDRTFTLPLPQHKSAPINFNWPVFLLVLTWISIGIHILLSGTYKPLIFRYFTGHRFFVDDVMRYRERSYLSGIFLFVQHTILSGLAFYVLAKFCISKNGLIAIYEVLPQLGLFGKNYFSLFALTILLTVILQLIGLAWLYIPNKSMTHFSQVLSLYTWIFHLDFVIVSIMLILLLTNGSGFFIVLLSVLFIATWLIGFFLTSFDSSKYLIEKRIEYIFKTFGLQTAVHILFLVLILTNDRLMDFISLIISI